MRAKRGEEKLEVRCNSLIRRHGVEWIYAPGTKSLIFVSSAIFLKGGVTGSFSL